MRMAPPDEMNHAAATRHPVFDRSGGSSTRSSYCETGLRCRLVLSGGLAVVEQHGGFDVHNWAQPAARDGGGACIRQSIAPTGLFL